MEILVYIALCIPLFPAILSVYQWKYLDPAQRWFSLLLWSIVIISFAGEGWVQYIMRNNAPFFYIYILIEYLIFIQIFKHLLDASPEDHAWSILSVAFTVLWIISAFFGQGWWVFPDYIRALEAIILLSLTSAWFKKMLEEKRIAHPERTFEFWLCAGLLVFFSGSILLFIFPKFLISAGEEVFEAIWKVHCILIILLYILYTVALLWVQRIIK